ncbi:MAG: family 43 glycosylhydrolase [Clostridia bacterium]|nr:family 43 glycosylhydrolase [Clostridia bacterium]
MKLKFDVFGKTQPDPFIFEDGDKLYLYASGVGDAKGVEVYSANDLFGIWHYEGLAVADTPKQRQYWAPSVIKHEGKYYMYVSFMEGKNFQFMHVLTADSPLGPFGNPVRLYDRFSIDSHAVRTDEGLFLWYAENNTASERIGTRVYVDKLLDPVTPAGICREVLVPTVDQEIFTPLWREDNKWHTLEGPFWFREGDWQYVMYSGGCYQDDTYHIGYAAAKTDEQDLTRIDFIKHTKNGVFDPVMIKNAWEEGTGHHSVIKYRGEYYAVYHARDYGLQHLREARTARVCKLHVADGIITAEPHEDRV